MQITSSSSILTIGAGAGTATFATLGALEVCEEVEVGTLGALGACEVFVTVKDDGAGFLAADEDPAAGEGAVRFRVLGKDERNDFSLA